ncbi:hypothetical protein [Microbacterium halophytorum]|uniref:hypothetical protein n=1 Tax=Microbacterium halophytorum TaxID=2067568 RepID=UPI000CFAD30D|nr:hypothetical protein [Microbacterium halophytorum]
MDVTSIDPRGRAYPVPWRVVRDDPRHPVVSNASDRILDTVRGFVTDRSGTARTDHFGTLRPGDAIELCLCRADTASAVVTIAWYRPGTDDEYLWRFVV